MKGEGGDKGQKGEKGDQVSSHTLTSFVMHPQQFVRSLKGLTTAEWCLKVLSPKKKKNIKAVFYSIQWTANQNAQSGFLFDPSDVS